MPEPTTDELHETLASRVHETVTELIDSVSAGSTPETTACIIAGAASAVLAAMWDRSSNDDPAALLQAWDALGRDFADQIASPRLDS
jgi:hypothetical protein